MNNKFSHTFLCFSFLISLSAWAEDEIYEYIAENDDANPVAFQTREPDPAPVFETHEASVCSVNNRRFPIINFRRLASVNVNFKEGIRLYDVNCRKCHGAINQTPVRGSTVAEIKDSIDTNKKMRGLDYLKHFSAKDLEAMAAALNASPSILSATDPDLLKGTGAEVEKKLSKKYFPGESKQNPPKRILRLTSVQFDSAVKSLLPSYFVESISKTLPKDPTKNNFELAENLFVNSANFPVFTDWIGKLAERVRKDPTAFINCKSENDSATCRTTQAEKFVVRAFRDDVDKATLKKFMNFFTNQISKFGFEHAAGDLVEVVLNSPKFMFRQELATTSDGKLSKPELISQASFVLADSIPSAVDVNSNMDVNAAIDKIVNSKNTRTKLRRFFFTWLEIKSPKDMKISTNIFPKFSLSVAKSLYADMKLTLGFALAKPEPRLHDIIQTKESYPTSDLDFIYQTGRSDMTGDKPIPFEPKQRFGIFSHPAFLASISGPTTTRLIRRGVFMTRKVMCMPLGDAPPGLNVTIKESTRVTERKRVEDGTNQKACLGCHSVLDPFGFVMENYDATGSWRERDNGFPIDPRVTLDVLEEGPADFSSPVEAFKSMTGSSRFRQCFVRQLFRYYMEREEEESDDPVLRKMYEEMSSNDNLLGILKVLAQSSQFQSRAK